MESRFLHFLFRKRLLRLQTDECSCCGRCVKRYESCMIRTLNSRRIGPKLQSWCFAAFIQRNSVMLHGCVSLRLSDQAEHWPIGKERPDGTRAYFEEGTA